MFTLLMVDIILLGWIDEDKCMPNRNT